MKINHLQKKKIFEVYVLIKDFINNFKGGEGDEEDLAKLEYEVSKYRICIHKDVFSMILQFIEVELYPMVYESELVFAETYSFGTVKDGVQHVDTEEDVIKMCFSFYEVLVKKDKELEKFAMENLYPLLIG